MRLNSQHQGLKLSAHLYRGLLRLFWHLGGETIASKDEPRGMGIPSVNVPGRQGVILQVPLMVLVGRCVQPSLGPPVCWETTAEIGLGMCHQPSPICLTALVVLCRVNVQGGKGKGEKKK